MKKKLFKIAAVVCMSVSLMFAGQITVFADEVKPIHEYNFDNDPSYKVLDTGSNPVNGSSFRNPDFYNQYRTGYNEVGKSYYFDGEDELHIVGITMSAGAESIRFKIKKDASTVEEKTEPIISKGSTADDYIYIGTIGKNDKNEDSSLIPGGLKIITKHFKMQTSMSICDGQWHDILFTWDGTINTNSVKLYVDDMATPISQATASSTNKDNKAQILLGNSQCLESGMFRLLKGYLDNIQIYSSVINPISDTSSNLKATAGNSKVDLNWNAVTDATSYTVKRSTIAGGSYTTIATGITGTTYTDTGITNGTTYYYVVTAIVNGSEGWNSNEASATPQASTDPNQPTGNKALLVIFMVTGERKEYEMTADKINDFIAWYNSKATSSPTYMIEKDYNKASFTARKDYIAYEQISNFEVNEYNK